MSPPEAEAKAEAEVAWRPSGPATSVPAVEKGPKRDPYKMLRKGLVSSLILQGIFLLVLAGAAIVASATKRSSLLYAWACVIPVGFALVAWLAYQRGVKVRRDGQWTRDWEKAEVKRNYRGLGAVLLVWMVGLLALLFLA